MEGLSRLSVGCHRLAGLHLVRHNAAKPAFRQRHKKSPSEEGLGFAVSHRMFHQQGGKSSDQGGTINL